MILKTKTELLSEKQAMKKQSKAAFIVHMAHLLKYYYQKDKQFTSWIKTIEKEYNNFKNNYKNSMESWFKDDNKLVDKAYNEFFKQTNIDKYEFEKSHNYEKLSIDFFLKLDLKKFLIKNAKTNEVIEYLKNFDLNKNVKDK